MFCPTLTHAITCSCLHAYSRFYSHAAQFEESALDDSSTASLVSPSSKSASCHRAHFRLRASLVLRCWLPLVDVAGTLHRQFWCQMSKHVFVFPCAARVYAQRNMRRRPSLHSTQYLEVSLLFLPRSRNLTKQTLHAFHERFFLRLRRAIRRSLRWCGRCGLPVSDVLGLARLPHLHGPSPQRK